MHGIHKLACVPNNDPAISEKFGNRLIASFWNQMGRIFLTFRVSQERLNARVILEGFEKAVRRRAIFGEI